MTTLRENFITALQGRQPVGLVPHFELVFYLTMEAFGRIHPLHRCFAQWHQMSHAERVLHIKDCADLYVQTARHYGHSAIFVHCCDGWGDNEKIELLREIRNISDNEFFLMIEGDATYAIPSGQSLIDFVMQLADDPEKSKVQAKEKVDEALGRAEIFHKNELLDGFIMCSDYCLNNGPFLSPAMFDEFVTPYLTTLIAGYREMGFYTIKHTDGNIMPILDSLVSAGPDALHSLDPQGGIDIANIKKVIGNKICLIGNVNCGLMDTGTDEQATASAEYALKNGMPNGGYIFSTSNCVYTGMPLHRYHLILDVWKKHGIYQNNIL